MRGVKRLAKGMLVACAGSSPVQRLNCAARRRQTVFLMYHGVRPDDEPMQAWTLAPVSSFREQMTFLSRRFECMSIDDALARDGDDARRPGAVVTFDDGYRNLLVTALPILHEFGIPATAYIATRSLADRTLFWHDVILLAAHRSGAARVDLRGIADPLRVYSLGAEGEQWYDAVAAIWEDVKRSEPTLRDEIVDRIVDRFMQADGASPFEIEVEGNVLTPLSADEIVRFADEPLITIGSHTDCHGLLDRMSCADADRSIRRSKSILEDVTGREIRHFSYPNGNYNDAVVHAVEDAGFVSAVTTRPGYHRPHDNPYEIRRYGVGAWCTLGFFKARLTGVFESVTRGG